MALVLGVDSSARRIAIVAASPVTKTVAMEAQNLYPKGETSQSPQSLGNALTFMRHFLPGVLHMAPEGERFAYVETVVSGKNKATAIKQAYTRGVVVACLVDAGFVVYDVNQSTWKAYLGIGQAARTAVAKAAMKAVLRQHWPKIVGSVGDDIDLGDAAGICLYGQEQLRKADVLVAPKHARGSVQGSGPRTVVRPARVRRGVRRP